MKRFHPTLLAIVLLLAACAPAPGRVTVRWLVDTGGGWRPDPAWVEGYNASQDEITLELVYEHFSPDWLRTQVAGAESGQAAPPDIVGPIGISLHRLLADVWMDLAPYYDTDDLRQIIPGALTTWQSEDGALTGLPVTASPLVLFYNRDLFDAAELPYPPHTFGEPYADGDAWTFEKLEELAIQLTLDESGKDPTDPDFNLGAIVQFGFFPQWLNLSEMAAPFGPATFGENGELPASWLAAFSWYWHGVREMHFIPDVDNFESGRLAMSMTYSTMTCCIENVRSWDIAVPPTYDGQFYGLVYSQGFSVLRTSEHPREAARAILALASHPGLATSLETFPAWLPLESAYFERNGQQQDVDWMVIADGLLMPAIPHYDRLPPFDPEANEAMSDFQYHLFLNPEGMNMKAALDELEARLQEAITSP